VAQKLGEVGSTGESTGAHLHLEIHINGVPVDPFAWLKANAN
jgi:murein DD-endopeptidase MepM/ murein hydrolase activator NlpD